jgi:hypothetical protein
MTKSYHLHKNRSLKKKPTKAFIKALKCRALFVVVLILIALIVINGILISLIV